MEGAEAGARGLLWASLMTACTAPLVADEAVPCEDIPCVGLSGSADEGFGAAVATDGEHVWVAASGSGLLRAFDRLGQVQAEWALDPG